MAREGLPANLSDKYKVKIGGSLGIFPNRGSAELTKVDSKKRNSGKENVNGEESRTGN